MRPRTLTEEKVSLAPITIETAKMFPAWVDDGEVARFLGHYHTVPDIASEEGWYKKVSESPTDFVWEIQFDGKVVGISGIHQVDWVNGYGVTGTIIGDKKVWRQGIGKTSMILRARFAFADLGLKVLETHVFVANIASQKATDRCGYQTIGVFPNRYFRQGKTWDVAIKVLTRENFMKLHQKD